MLARYPRSRRIPISIGLRMRTRGPLGACAFITLTFTPVNAASSTWLIELPDRQGFGVNSGTGPPYAATALAPPK